MTCEARTSHLRHLRPPTRTRTPPSRHVICLQLMAHTNCAWDRFHFFHSSEAAATPLHVHDGDTLSGGASSVRDECHPDRPFAQRILSTYLVVVEDYRGSRVSKAVATERLVNVLSGCQQSDHERRSMSRTRSLLHSGSTSISSTISTESKHECWRKVPLMERITTERGKT
jgi:hypothetical protein